MYQSTKVEHDRERVVVDGVNFESRQMYSTPNLGKQKIRVGAQGWGRATGRYFPKNRLIRIEHENKMHYSVRKEYEEIVRVVLAKVLLELGD